jgi:hypothetical protein
MCGGLIIRIIIIIVKKKRRIAIRHPTAFGVSNVMKSISQHLRFVSFTFYTVIVTAGTFEPL